MIEPLHPNNRRDELAITSMSRFWPYKDMIFEVSGLYPNKVKSETLSPALFCLVAEGLISSGLEATDQLLPRHEPSPCQGKSLLFCYNFEL